MCVTLLNKRIKNNNKFSAVHNSMTKLCSALFKYDNKLEIGREN